MFKKVTLVNGGFDVMPLTPKLVFVWNYHLFIKNLYV